MGLYFHVQTIDFIKGYMMETKCLNGEFIPTTEEHQVVAYQTGGGSMLIPSCYLGMGDIVTKEAIKWTLKNPYIFKCASIIGRVINDIAGHKVRTSIILF